MAHNCWKVRKTEKLEIWLKTEENLKDGLLLDSDVSDEAKAWICFGFVACYSAVI